MLTTQAALQAQHNLSCTSSPDAVARDIASIQVWWVPDKHSPHRVASVLGLMMQGKSNLQIVNHHTTMDLRLTLEQVSSRPHHRPALQTRGEACEFSFQSRHLLPTPTFLPGCVLGWWL